MQCAEIYGHVELLQGCDCVDAATGLRDNITVAAPRSGVANIYFSVPAFVVLFRESLLDFQQVCWVAHFVCFAIGKSTIWGLFLLGSEPSQANPRFGGGHCPCYHLAVLAEDEARRNVGGGLVLQIPPGGFWCKKSCRVLWMSNFSVTKFLGPHHRLLQRGFIPIFNHTGVTDFEDHSFMDQPSSKKGSFGGFDDFWMALACSPKNGMMIPK